MVDDREQRADGGAAQGREDKYALRALPMRVNSLVPKKTADIRDTSPDTFADIEVRRLRSNGELVAAAISFAFALVLIGLALVRVVGPYRGRAPAAIRPRPLGFLRRRCPRAA